MELQHFSHEHKLQLNEKNNLDPDEGISSICFICDLPIFYTPYYSCSTAGCDDFFIHQLCADLPKQLKHITGINLGAGVRSHRTPEVLCNKCHRNCGHVAWITTISEIEMIHRMAYGGRTREIFDAICATHLRLRIFHGSHEHELIPINIEELTICGACGLRHENQCVRTSSLFYWCFWCNLWLHENCATLPNYIRHREHTDHPLALTYALPRGDQISYCCGICSDTITSLGIYFCGKCSYYAHIKCATHCSEHYEHVPSHQIGEQSNYWIQFPMEEEDTSLVSHILENMKLENPASSGSIAGDKHDHPLIFNAINASPGRALICDGCVQPISSPYYSCSHCTDYLLHQSCANLPPSIIHPEHKHRLSLVTNYDKFGFYCKGCDIQCNGFLYECKECYFKLDVQCAFLPKSITHRAHDKRHILRLNRVFEAAKCCNKLKPRDFHYTCTGFNCDFKIHGFCAGLPMSTRHKFDKHPLKLTMGSASITSDHHDGINFCEFCEEKIYSTFWYYYCAECNNSFHVKCIPAVGQKSKIKLRAGLKMFRHHHPLTSIRLLTTVSRNYRCGKCFQEIPNFTDELAFECSECDLTFHDKCTD